MVVLGEEIKAERKKEVKLKNAWKAKLSERIILDKRP